MNSSMKGLYEYRVRQYEKQAEFAKAQLIFCKKKLPQMTATWKKELKDCQRHIKEFRNLAKSCR